MKRSIEALKDRVEQGQGFGEIIGKDPKMQVIYKLIEDVAPSDATVLSRAKAAPARNWWPGPFISTAPAKEALLS